MRSLAYDKTNIQIRRVIEYGDSNRSNKNSQTKHKFEVQTNISFTLRVEKEREGEMTAMTGIVARPTC
jgi:hypothetical protein